MSDTFDTTTTVSPETATDVPGQDATLGSDVPQDIQDQLSPERLQALEAQLQQERERASQYEGQLQQLEQERQRIAIEQSNREMQQVIDRNIADLYEKVLSADNADQGRRLLSQFTSSIMQSMTEGYTQIMESQEALRQQAEQQMALQKWAEQKPAFIDKVLKERNLPPQFKGQLSKFDHAQVIIDAADGYAEWVKQQQAEAAQNSGRTRADEKRNAGAFTGTKASGSPEPRERLKGGSTRDPDILARGYEIFGLKRG